MENIFDKVDLSEMIRLGQLLDDKGIPYDVRPRFNGLQIVVPSIKAYMANEKCSISAVCFDGSYGSANGLIEVYAPQLNAGVEGNLDADEALSYIEDTMAGISRGSCG